MPTKAKHAPKAPPFPQGQFTTLEALASQALRDTVHVPKTATELCVDWLLTRKDLTDTFARPILAARVREVIDRLTQYQPPPARPRTTAQAEQEDFSMPIPPAIDPLARELEAAYQERGRVGSAQWLERVLLDGMLLGDATSGQLRQQANQLFGLTQRLWIERHFYDLLAKALPDEQTRVRDHLDEQAVARIWKQAEDRARK